MKTELQKQPKQKYVVVESIKDLDGIVVGTPIKIRDAEGIFERIDNEKGLKIIQMTTIVNIMARGIKYREYKELRGYRAYEEHDWKVNGTYSIQVLGDPSTEQMRVTN